MSRRARAARLAAVVAASGLLLSLSTQPGWAADDWGDAWDDGASAWSFHGFAEAAAGVRLRRNPVLDERLSLGEVRVQWGLDYDGAQVRGRLKLDTLGDLVDESLQAEVREAQLSFVLGQRTDVRLGRQVLTWGTGDLVFLNDLFPKDWHALLLGREDEYLKAPANAARLSWFGALLNLDLVLLPVFTPDRYVDGERVAYFDPAQDALVAAPPKLRTFRPARRAANAEWALRLYGMAGGQEWALYGYRGFYGQPTAFDPGSGKFGFARLNALGGSLRGPLRSGLYNLELAWYDAAHNRSGTNPLLPNSEFRFLAGYEQELLPRLSLGLQYYLEWMQDYDAYRANYPFAAETRSDELRHLLSTRLHYRMAMDRITLGMMLFYSPSDADFFLRPNLTWRQSDQLQVSAGANWFGGSDDHSFYGQFARDSSLYVRARYAF